MKLAIISCLVMLAVVAQASKSQDAVGLITRLLAAKEHPHSEHPHSEHPHKEHPHSEHPHKEHPHSNGFSNVQVLNSAELLKKMRTFKSAKTRSFSHRHLSSACDNAYIELEDTQGAVEEGIVLYPKELASLLPPSTRAHRQCQDVTCDFQLSVNEDQMVFIYVYMWSLTGEAPACGADGAGWLSLYAGTSTLDPLLGDACGDFEQAMIPDAQDLYFTFADDPNTPIGFFIYYEVIQKDEVLESVDHGEDEPTATPVAPVADAGVADAAAEDPAAAADPPAAADPTAEPTTTPAADPAAGDPAAAVRRAFARLNSAKKQKSRPPH